MIEGYLETQEDKDKYLCKTLREESRTRFDPKHQAAARIETLLEEVMQLKKELLKQKEGPNKNVVIPPIEIIGDSFNNLPRGGNLS